MATFFQHGILWYNSLAMMLLTLIVWSCAILNRLPHIRARNLAALCFLLFLSSMCKMNFHMLGLGLACLILLLRSFKIGRDGLRHLIWMLPLIALSGLVLGPFAEIVANGTSPHVFLDNVFGTSAKHLNSVLGFLNPNLYLGIITDCYPDNWSSGIYLKAVQLYDPYQYDIAKIIKQYCQESDKLLIEGGGWGGSNSC